MRPRAIARRVGRKVARGTLIACMIVPMATFVIYVKGKTAVYNKKLKARLKRRRDAAPTPLSTREQVAAQLRMDGQTAGPDGPTSMQKRDQEQSIFFRLPPEIRQMIYETLLADSTFHVERRRKMLGHTKCGPKSDASAKTDSTTTNNNNKEPCACEIVKRTKDEAPWQLWRDSSCSACGTVPMLQTCRRAYDEAIHLLYARNRFTFDHLDTLYYFTLAIRPDQLRLITSIQLSWSFAVPWYNELPVGIKGWLYPPYDEVTWIEIWRTIAGMRGLRDLRVRVYDSVAPRTEEAQRAILAPMKVFPQGSLEKFKVSLPENWFRASEENDDPFVVELKTPLAYDRVLGL